MNMEAMEEANLPGEVSYTQKTLERYRGGYELFMKWHESNGYTSFDEDVLLDYLNHSAKTYQGSSLQWRICMLKRTLLLYKGIDIRPYTRLNDFLKERNISTESIQGKVFSIEEINRFMTEAPDDYYLAMKAIMIFGMTGGCSSDELHKIRTDHVKDYGTEVIVSAPRNRKTSPPIFLISGAFARIVQKYMHQRPTRIQWSRFFVRYSQGEYESNVFSRKAFDVVPKEIAKFLKLEDYKSYNGHSYQPANHGKKKRNLPWKLQLSSDVSKPTERKTKSTKPSNLSQTEATASKCSVKSVPESSIFDVESVIIKSEIDMDATTDVTGNEFSDLTTAFHQNHNNDVSSEPFVPMLPATIALMKWKPSYYVGMEQNQFLKILQLAAERNVISDLKLMLTLRKLRLDEDIEVLADAFDLDRTIAEKYYNESKHEVIALTQSVSNSFATTALASTANNSITSFESTIKIEKCLSLGAVDPITTLDETSASDMDDANNLDDFEIILPETTKPKVDPRFLDADIQRRTEECPECHKFFSRRLINSHMDNVHFNQGNLNRTICGLCWKECESKASLKAHQKDVHRGGIYGCDICGKLFRSKQYLSAHILTKHARVKTYLCDTCGEGFPTPYWLHDHNKRKHNEPAHACHLCNMKFVTAMALKDHIVARHTNERPYQCMVKGCGKTFSWPSSFKSHARVHLKEKFECSICLKGFSFKGNLRNHLKIIHNQVVDNKCLISKFS